MRSARCGGGVLLTFALLASCAGDQHKYLQPNVAVIPFETRDSFPYFDRGIGSGVADLLADSLYQTGYFRVIDRADLGAVLSEQDLQGTGLTRPEERVPTSRLKNVNYLVRGVVTDFSHVARGGIDLGVGPLRFGSGGNHAIVSLAIKVIEVESGEIVFSQVVDGDVYAGDIEIGSTYRNVSFGGQQFFQTPLGGALQRALNTAVDGISERIGRQPWHPVIAKIDGNRVMLSGGKDRRVALGSRWRVRDVAKPIWDPVTGDRLGQEPGGVLGTVRVVDVEEKYAVSIIEEGGGFERGLRLEAILPPPEP